MLKNIIIFFICLLFTPVPSHAKKTDESTVNRIKIACEQLKELEEHYSDNYISNTEYFSKELNQTIDKRYFIDRLVIVSKLQKYFQCSNR